MTTEAEIEAAMTAGLSACDMRPDDMSYASREMNVRFLTAALHVAEPLIRERLAQEVEAERDRVTRGRSAYTANVEQNAFSIAARIVRGDAS